MSRFPHNDEESNAPETRELFREITEAGFGAEQPINWFTSQSARPDILRATWELTRGILVNGRLPSSVKQMIAMAASHQNNCRYCTVTHAHVLEQLGIPEAVIESCMSDPNLSGVPDPHRTIVRFALKTVRDPNSLTDADYQSLRDQGLSGGEIMEVVMMAAFTKFINTWADAGGIDLDVPEAG